MSDALEKAEAAAAEAENNTVAVQLALAAIELAKLSAQQPPHHDCQHHTPQQQFDARKWWTIGGLAIVGGCVACALAMAFAMAMVAVAIGATCATACLLILRRLWQDFQKGH